MSYKVLSLKWRPQTFEDIVGQDHVTKTLINAFKLERVAQGYMFTGPRGVGKTTTARILSRALNADGEPRYDFDPSTGTLALYYIINTNIYNNILLVGFDNFKKGDQTYYYKTSEYNNKLNYLFEKNIVKSDGIFNIINGHDPDKTKIWE